MKLTPEEVLEGNQLIADFMGVTLEGSERNGFFYVGVPEPFTRHLGYHASWDWMMPVAEKINAMGKAFSLAVFKNYVSLTIEKGGKFYKDFSYSHAEYITAEQTGKIAMFKLLVSFVKWQNEQERNNNLKTE